MMEMDLTRHANKILGVNRNDIPLKARVLIASHKWSVHARRYKLVNRVLSTHASVTMDQPLIVYLFVAVKRFSF